MQQIIELQLEHLFKSPKVHRAAIVSSPVPILIKVHKKPTGKQIFPKGVLKIHVLVKVTNFP